MTSPETVQAEVLDNDLAITEQEFAIDLGIIAEDIQALCKALSKAQTSARQLEVTDEALQGMDYSVAKNFATSLNKDIAEVDNLRKKLKSDFTQPMTDTEAKIKAFMRPVVELQAKYKAQQTLAEDIEKAQKLDDLRSYYEELAPFIALPLGDQTRALVPFERIANPKWSNRTFSLTKAQQEIEERVAEIAKQQALLEATALEYRDEAMAEFWETLSVEAALNRDRQLIDQAARARALQEEQQRLKEEREAQQREQERMAAERRAEFDATEVTAQEAAEPAPVEEDVPHEYQMTVTLTRTQLRQFTQAMATLGIHGNLRRVN